MFVETCKLPNSENVTELYYLTVLNEEVQILNDGFNQYNQIFKLSLMQILWADHCNSLAFYPHKVDQMEE